MGIISIENADRLFWLGRYTERVYTTLQLFSEHFDEMIDQNEESYRILCDRLDIPCIYTSAEDFVDRYCFDETDTNSIISNMLRAYDNGIMLRDEIGSETLAYIQMCVYVIRNARGVDTFMIEFQKVMDYIMAFWGMEDDFVGDENARNIVKVGKRLERIDMYARLKMGQVDLSREVLRLAGRINRTDLKYRAEVMEEVKNLAQSEEINYSKIVYLVENELLEA